MAKLSPLTDRIIAVPDEADEKTASGILLTQGAQEKPKTAKVIEVGPDVKQVKKGDQIIYEEFASTSVKVGGDDYIIVKEEKVLATVK